MSVPVTAKAKVIWKHKTHYESLTAIEINCAHLHEPKPCLFHKYCSKLGGFDVDIALALCERMGVECELRRHEWETLVPELRTGI